MRLAVAWFCHIHCYCLFFNDDDEGDEDDDDDGGGDDDDDDGDGTYSSTGRALSWVQSRVGRQSIPVLQCVFATLNL